MNEKEYLSERVEDQIKWYDKKSTQNKIWYKVLRTTEIIVSILIPFLVGVITNVTLSKFIIGIMGIIIAVIAGIISLYKFQENWIQFRATSENLKNEKYLFLTCSDIYQEENSFPTFVKKIEYIISNENHNWSSYIKEDRSKKDKTND